jgi:hypothetical protein
MTRNGRELADNFDLERLTPEFYADPYPTYRALRKTSRSNGCPTAPCF